MNRAVIKTRTKKEQSIAIDTNAVKILWQSQTLSRLLLSVFVLSSALLVVYTKYLNRNLHIQLQQLQENRDKLHIEWTQLLLEQGTLGSDIRVTEIAKKRLNMQSPTPDQVLVVKP